MFVLISDSTEICLYLQAVASKTVLSLTPLDVQLIPHYSWEGSPQGEPFFISYCSINKRFARHEKNKKILWVL
jgi:hypothetical protein